MFKKKLLETTKILIVILSTMGMSLEASATGYSINGSVISTTPFDGKLTKAGVLNDDFLVDGNGHDSMENLFFRARRLHYVSDPNGDHWQTPQETERRGAGDCEDKAVWLYSQLKQNGFSNVRIVIGKYRSFERKYHVWVTYTNEEGTTFLLDPAVQKRAWDIHNFSSGFYQPIYSFDGHNRYRHYSQS